ncbi:unnamed protein product, partial [Mesorhabditis spiculigera]
MGPSSLDTVIPIGGSLSESMAESQCVPLPAVKKNIYHGSREYFASHRPVALRTSTPTPSLKSICSLDGEVFFDQLAKPELHIGPTVPPVATVDDEGKETDALLETYGAAVGRRNRRFRTLCVVPPPSYREQLAFGDSRLAMPTKTTLGRPEPIDIVPGPTERPPAVPSLGDRILLNVKSGIIDNRQNKIRTRRKMGEGVFGRLCLRKMKKQSELPANLRQQIANTSDERPFFTYWITTVQVIICLLSVLFYGFGPVGFSRVERKELVMHTSVTLKMVSMYEPANFWLGPSHANLIRLGAKYSPCMRLEPSIWKLIEKDRRDENQTGCCIYDDGSGCFQTTEENCPSYGARFHSWSTRPPRRRPSKPQVLPLFDATYTGEKAVVEALFSGNSKYTVGPVCGQDPGMCKTPPSSPPTEWKNDLSQWPICESVYKVSAYPDHMKCKLTGRPCCLMQLGQCRIATREYCAFVQGTYHENATLCSQVHCMEDVCGMVPFLIKDRPDQASRLFISLFLHAGLIHCALTVGLQLWLLRDLEQLIGWRRMAILYFGSGVGGNMASSIFVPFLPQVGPTASLIGIQGSLLVEVYNFGDLIDTPWKAYIEHLFVILVLLMIGLFPWVDNWTHLFGFIFGLLISVVIFPYINLMDMKKDPEGYEKEQRRRKLIIAGALLILIPLTATLTYIFFWNIPIECKWCAQFNCLPFLNILIGDQHFCDNQGLELENILPI